MHPGELANTREARFLSDLTRDELGREFARAMTAAMASSRGASRRDVARRALDDPELRAVLDEFARRHWTGREEFNVWCDYASRVLDVATTHQLL